MSAPHRRPFLSLAPRTWIAPLSLALLAGGTGPGCGTSPSDSAVVEIAPPSATAPPADAAEPAAAEAPASGPAAAESAAPTPAPAPASTPEPAPAPAPEAAAAPAEPAPAGWGTLKGRVVFSGDVPELPPLVPAGADPSKFKDGEVCTANGAVPSEKLVVDPASKGVRWALVYLPKPTAVNPEALSAAQSQTVEFDQKNCAFVPHVLAVMKGNKVQLRSSDKAGHNVHLLLKNTNFNQGIQPGTTVPLEIKAADNRPMPVVCDIHPWMKGYWLTLDNPYFVVTNAQGEFELPNVPAGTQKVVVWTEAGNLLTPATGQEITIEAGGTTSRDFTLEASKVK